MLFRAAELDSQELAVLEHIDGLRATLRFSISEHRRWWGSLRRSLFARAIQGSNSIEGYNVTLDDALAVTEGEDPLEADLPTWRAVSGYREAMTYVMDLSDEPHFSYSEDLVRSLHYMMIKHTPEKLPGRWRRGFVYVRENSSGEIVYEAPDAGRVPELMAELVESLQSDSGSPAIVRAAMAHLNLVLIHPFLDGNGRMARCLQTLVLAREGIVAPEFSSIEEYLGRNTPAYYDVLAEVGRGYWQPKNDPRPWIRFCLKAHYFQAQTVLRRTKEAQRLWELLTNETEKRGLPDRMIYALWDAAKGYRVRRATYLPVAKVEEHTATRDLRMLVQAGLLMPRGERRGRFYVASEPLQQIHNRSLETKTPMRDPFVRQGSSGASPGPRSRRSGR
jgi:Fic family protein